jgi:uncharacterized membrane protein
MSGSDTRYSEPTLKGRSSRSSRRVVHAFLLVFGLVLAFIVGGLIFNYQPNYNFYFALSFTLFLFVFAQCFYELGGRKTILFLVISSIIGFGFEVLGTSTGFLFGKYYYSSLLGEQVLGVPVVVPLAWFVITYITFSLALSKYSTNRIGKGVNFSGMKIRSFILPIILSSLGTVAWDLMIDPMFSNLNPPYWTWEISPSTPQLYHVPLSNFLGWFVVALIVLTAFVVSLKYRGKGPIKVLARTNTWDSRIAYILLMIDGAVANEKLGQSIAVLIGIIAMSAFLLITFKPTKREQESPMKPERTAQFNDSK